MGCGISKLPKLLDSNSQEGSPSRISEQGTLKHLLKESTECFSSSDGELDLQLFEKSNFRRDSSSSSSSHDIHYHNEQQINEVNNDHRQYSVILLDPSDANDGKLDSTSDAESGIELTDHKNSDGAFIREENIPSKPIASELEESQISIVEAEDEEEENLIQSSHESPKIESEIISEIKVEEVSNTIKDSGDAQCPLDLKEAQTSFLVIVNPEEEIDEEQSPKEIEILPQSPVNEKNSPNDQLIYNKLEKYDPGTPNESKLHPDAGSLILDMEPLNSENDSEEIIVIEEDNEILSFTDLEITETEIHVSENDVTVS